MKRFISVKNGKVVFIHRMPFHPEYGLGKTEAELSQIGILLDDIPEPEKIEGKVSVPYYSSTQGFFYKYEDLPKRDHRN